MVGRWVLVLVLVLLCPALATAGDVRLAFDYPVYAQASSRYILRSRVVIAQQTTATERPLTLLGADECKLHAPGWNVDTLCASTCVPPGDYSFTVYAISTEYGTNGESNVLDVDVTDGGLCEPPIPVPKPPQKPPPPVAPVAVGAALAAAAAAVVATFPGGSLALPDAINFDCVQPTIGVCVCGFPPHPCVQVSYWEPAWLVETVKKPGDTVIPFLGDLLKLVLGGVGIPLFGAGGAANATGSGHTNIQFNEAHVYTFPNVLGGPCTGCAPSPRPPFLNFASEIDPLWRTATNDVPLPMGVWQRWYPRGGKSIHSSEPVGSGICAARALDVAFLPVGLPPSGEVHVVTTPTDGTSTCMQLASPIRTPCFTAGTPPPLWETGTLSIGGKYVWSFWRFRQCCVEAAQSVCGITTPGIGRGGQNGCVVPSTP